MVLKLAKGISVACLCTVKILINGDMCLHDRLSFILLREYILVHYVH